MNSTTIIIILNLFILESLLSVDNAAVLAVMVKDLPKRQKKRALRYGLLGAYLFRGACLFVASWLVKILWLKIIGGIYLCYLVFSHFTKANDSLEESVEIKDSQIYKGLSKLGINRFWSTVVLVEVMDLAFSIDNIFAAVALSNNFIIIMIGVAVGILAMRFVAGWFVTLIEKYPTLETSAFIVIAILGVKLIFTGSLDYSTSFENVKEIVYTHTFDLCFSAAMMLIFFIPLLTHKKITYGKQES